MKKPVYHLAFTLALFFIVHSFLSAQSPTYRQRVVGASQLVPIGPTSLSSDPTFQAKSVVQNTPIAPVGTNRRGVAGKIATVSPVGMGRTSNAYSGITTHQNQVFANDSLNFVGFIHRQDVTIWGGGSANNGKLRYDISLNGGTSFSNDIGPLNNTYTWPARYPNAGLYNMGGSTNPLNAKIGYIGSTISSPTWNGYVSGTSTISLTTPVATETYHGSTDYFIPSSMTERVPGEFWAVAPGYDGTGWTDSLFVLKGTHNGTTQDIDWITVQTLTIAHDETFDGTIHLIHPEIAFSPDGTSGWIAWLGDIPGGPQHLFSPIFMQSTNGGNSWGSPIEVNLNAQSYVSDSLQSLWITTNPGVPASTGMATGTFEFDLTVDATGSPHMFTVIGSAQSQDSSATPSGPPTYVVFSALSKFAADIHSTNGGTNFTVDYVAPILTFRGDFGTPDPSNGSLLAMENFPQISRSEDGNYVFYSWVDSDTTIIGFGESTNLAPNLRIAGYSVQNGFRTCYKLITDGDFVWDGRAMFPTMAPTVLTSGSTFELPIVGLDMITNNQLEPCAYWYFGNDCSFSLPDFMDPTGMGYAWGSSCAAPNYVTVEGTVYNDLNNNGIKDTGEPGLVNRILEMQPGNRYAMTDSAGFYQVRGNSLGTFDVSLTPISYWFQTAPTSPNTHSVTFTTPLQVESNKDFGQYAPSPITDDAVSLACGPVRPGRTSSVVISYQNRGTVPSSGTVEMTYDPLFTLQTALPTQTAHNATARTLTWNYSNLQPWAFGSIQVFFDNPTNTSVGTVITHTVHLSTTSAIDEDTTSNYDTCSVTVTGSYDPNDKRVMPAGSGPENRVDPDTPLRYIIRFQNTGNDTAFYVRVEDQLDPDLDPATFRMLGASHPFSYSIQGGGLVSWVFDPIELPDSGRDEPNSHGYIQYTIQPRSGLALGTEVHNSASIFFDFNAPVITNQTLTTYDLADFVFPPATPQGLILFPNPSEGTVTLELTDWNGIPYDVSVINLQGQTVREIKSIDQTRYRMNRGELPAGMYLVTLRQYGKLLSSTKLIWMK